MSVRTVAVTELQARRALAIARWMVTHGGDAPTRKRCRELVRALDAALADPADEVRRQKRAEWRAASERYRERKRARAS